MKLPQPQAGGLRLGTSGCILLLC